MWTTQVCLNACVLWLGKLLINLQLQYLLDALQIKCDKWMLCGFFLLTSIIEDFGHFVNVFVLIGLCKGYF